MHILLLVLIISTLSCKKFIEVEAPSTSINGINVFSNDATAASVLTGIYTSMSNESFPNGITAMSILPELSGDELMLADLNNVMYRTFYQNALISTTNTSFWNSLYTYIYKANAAIEGLGENADKLTPAIQKQLLGEAKFIRAFCYFYLTNLYGDLPLAISTDPIVNQSLFRTAKQDIYQRIIGDLKDAQSLMSDNYLSGDITNNSTERVRPNKLVATALLARVYLYNSNWSLAETEASKILANTSFQLSSFSQAFLRASTGNKEAIWQLQPTGTTTNSNTKEGRFYILPSTGPGTSFPACLSDTLIKNFEVGDLRKTNWVSSVTPSPGTTTYYYPYKYKIGAVNTATTEYSMVMRLGEQYLIRAEARAQQNKLSESIADIDSVRKRAGLPLISVTNPAISQTALLDKIFHERQVELFTEWGHRWFDLKRTGRLDALMTIITPRKGGVWNSNWALYPIPQVDIDRNPNLVGHQNPGY